MLFDIREGEWSPELCELFGVPVRALPEVRPSIGDFGRLADDALPGFDGTPLAGIAGDQQAALYGQAALEPGQGKNTYGTGSFVLVNTGTSPPDPAPGLLSTIGWGIGGRTVYAREAPIFVTGAAVQWLRDGLGVIDDAAECGPLAESVDDTAGVVVVPAFTGLGAPYWDPYARGAVLGITRGAGRAHLARAVVESMAYQTRDVVEAMTAASGTTIDELRVDGGAAAMDLLLRLQADQLGVPVARSAVSETTALGAAYLAGLGVGLWSSAAEVSAAWHADARVEPAGDRTMVDPAYAQWRRAVDRSRGWARD